MLRLQQTAVPALLVAPALARTLLALLGLVRAFGNGRHTLAPTGRAIAARARIRGSSRSLDCPEDLLPTYGNAAGSGAVASNAGHASYLAYLSRSAINDLDGLEGFLLVHVVVCWRLPCDVEPCVACSSSAILVPAGWR